MRRLSAILAAGAILSACSTDPVASKPTAQLNFLRLAPTAPPLSNASDSFWAVSGQDRELRMYFQPAAPGEDSSMLLEFKVPGQALLRRPDGTAFAPGDSVLIHVAVIDTLHMIVAFEPAGLVFSAATPAELKFEFGECNQDINDDGVVNATDDSLKAALHLWRQESSTQPWFQLSTIVNVSSEEADAKIYGFTNYALAY